MGRKERSTPPKNGRITVVLSAPLHSSIASRRRAWSVASNRRHFRTLSAAFCLLVPGTAPEKAARTNQLRLRREAGRGPPLEVGATNLRTLAAYQTNLVKCESKDSKYSFCQNILLLLWRVNYITPYAVKVLSDLVSEVTPLHFVPCTPRCYAHSLSERPAAGCASTRKCQFRYYRRLSIILAFMADIKRELH